MVDDGCSTLYFLVLVASLWIISGSKGDTRNNHNLPVLQILIQWPSVNAKKIIVSSIISH